jgi:bacterioferritin-associated ferredoxin
MKMDFNMAVESECHFQQGVDGDAFEDRSGAMIVCLCEGVSEREIRRVRDRGAKDVDGVAHACGAGAHCGQCRSQIRDILSEPGRDGPTVRRATSALPVLGLPG